LLLPCWSLAAVYSHIPSLVILSHSEIVIASSRFLSNATKKWQHFVSVPF
jgi:hypothetical protein